jgi:hypothetical protein
MYVTAMRVRAPDGRVGINVALYRHLATDLPAHTWDLPGREALDLIATEKPGKRVAHRVDVAPGGNHVEAFIDVVAPDGTSVDAIAHALDALRLACSDETRVWRRSGNVVAEFCTNLGASAPEAWFTDLHDAVLGALSGAGSLNAAREKRLTIVVGRDDDGWHFRLTEAAIAYLRAEGVEPPRPGAIRVPYDVADDFRSQHGPLYPYIAEWLTGASRDRLLALGGVRFVDGEQTVAEWPAT